MSFATTFKAKADGKMAYIDGVYGMCPYIYGMYGHGLAEEAILPSLKENDRLFLGCDDLKVLAHVYLKEGENVQDNHMAWPYWAKPEILTGLPPHVISLNELDPLFSEGLEYYRKLNAAGVSVRCRTVHGTTHAGDLLFMNALPDLFESTANDILFFAKSI